MKTSIGFPGLLALLFIALKLTGHITWSWLWVLSPLWIGFAIFLAIVFIWLGVIGIGALIESNKAKSRARKITGRRI